MIITVVAPVNIAVIKYWGKQNDELIIPLNDSVSATLDTGVMCAKTSVCASPKFTENTLWLNGKKESFGKERLENVLHEIKARAASENSVDEDFLTWKVHVSSFNNFPTAAGLASSAAGYAGLVAALSKLYKITSEISSIARLGSGSACRSVYGGFVRWHAGTNSNGSDSLATQVAKSTHWPEMRALILVVGESKKKVTSTKGMKISAKTSELLQYRVKHCVPKRTEAICKAILDKDFSTFAEITMKDSNQFHAVCLDSYPPFMYMNETSLKIIDLIHEYNNLCGATKVAYTFDAGPNACLYLLEDQVPKILSIIKHVFPSTSPNYFRGLTPEFEDLGMDFLDKLSKTREPENLIKYVIYTKIGEGPTEITDNSHLLHEDGSLIEKLYEETN